MIIVIGVYFSGTGNTRRCVQQFVNQYDEHCVAISIESPDVYAAISGHDALVIGYPVYFSNMPRIVQVFIHENRACFAGKKVFIIATMGLFSGDGAGCAARLLKKCGAEITGGLHLKMPDSIGDEKALKRPLIENQALITKANAKITSAIHRLKEGNPTTDGLGFFSHIAGLLGQRLWFYKKSTSYKSKPDVDDKKCIGCGRCVALCPMQNIAMEQQKAVSLDMCTLCYRCFSHCPTQALTILGKHVYEQCLVENYE